MKLKTLLVLGGMLFAAVSANADVTRRKALEITSDKFVQVTADGETVHYLYNVEAKAFYDATKTGGNGYWGSRASVLQDDGAQIKVVGVAAGTEGDPNAAEHHELITDAKTPGTFIRSFTNDAGDTWTDNDGELSGHFWHFNLIEGTTTYTITNDKNVGYLGATLDTDERLYFYNEADKASKGTTWAFITPETFQDFMELLKTFDLATFNASEKLYAALQQAYAYPSIDVAAYETAYENMETTAAQFNTLTTELLAKIDQAKLDALYADLATATKDAPKDATSLINNPTLDSNNAGWEGTKFAIDQKHGEIYNQNYDAYQKIATKTHGVYKLQATAFYRAGLPGDASKNEAHPAWINYQAGADHAKLYAASGDNKFTSSIVNAFEGLNPNDNSTVSGVSEIKTGEYTYWIPNNRVSARAFYDQGLYKGNTVMFGADSDESTIGILKEFTIGGDWTTVDDFTLTYYGNGADAYQMWMDDVISNYKAFVVEENTLVTKSVVKAYNTALTTNTTAATHEDVVANKKAIDEAKKALDENLAEWNDFKAKYDDAVKVGANEELDLENPMIIELGTLCGENALDALKNIVMYTADTEYFKDVLGEFTVPTAVFLDGNPENCYDPENIDPRQFTGEELNTLAEALHKLANEALEAALKPGTDVTQYIKDAKFDLADMNHETAKWGAWQHEQSGAVNNFRIGAKCCEAWNVTNFDVFQTIEGLPEGVYEIRMSGFYRADRDDKAWNKYFEENGQPKANPTRLDVAVYLNQSRADMKNVFDEQILADDPIWSYTENPNIYKDKMGDEVDGQPTAKYAYANDMASAAAAFDAGKYQSAARGLIKKGDIARIGVKGHVEGDNWCIFDNFALTYLGYDKDVIKEEIEKMLPKLSVSEEEPVATDVLANMNAVKATAESAPAEATGADLFKILADMTSVLEEVDNSKSTFKTISEKFAEIEGFIADAGDDEEGAAKYLNYQEVVDFYGNNQDFSALTQEEAEQLVKDADEIIAKMAYPNYQNASDKDPADFTFLIKNPGFNGNMNDWVNDGTEKLGAQSNNSYPGKEGSHYAERWHANGTINLSQTITELPAGGYWIVSANAQATDNIEDAVLTINGVTAKIANAGSTKIKDNDTYYATIYVEEGQDITIGASCTLDDASWFCIDDFHLYYTGEDYPESMVPTDAIKVEGNKVVKMTGIFNISGMRQNSIQKGLNIIRRADGTVVKVLK